MTRGGRLAARRGGRRPNSGRTSARRRIDRSWLLVRGSSLLPLFADVTSDPYRLPADTEWEAAATNPEGPFPWGMANPTEEHANFGKTIGHPTPVGLFPLGAAPGGHMDMAGNVWEWCVDKLSTGGKPSPSQRAPFRVLRGGGGWSDADYLRSASSSLASAVNRQDDVWFPLGAASREPCSLTDGWAQAWPLGCAFRDSTPGLSPPVPPDCRRCRTDATSIAPASQARDKPRRGRSPDRLKS